MTRKFNIKYTCQHCGKQTTAETDFGRWMRNHPDLDVVNGIVRTDMDHIILRYKTSLDQRDFQLMMVVEVKERGAESDPCQIDILSFLRQAIERKQLNMYQRVRKDKKGGVGCLQLYSKLNHRWVRFRFFGVFLLQFENTGPANSKWIKWNRQPITEGDLVGLLAMERHPLFIHKNMIEFLRDRHAKDPNPDLFSGDGEQQAA